MGVPSFCLFLSIQGLFQDILFMPRVDARLLQLLDLLGLCSLPGLLTIVTGFLARDRVKTVRSRGSRWDAALLLPQLLLEFLELGKRDFFLLV